MSIRPLTIPDRPGPHVAEAMWPCICLICYIKHGTARITQFDGICITTLLSFRSILIVNIFIVRCYAERGFVTAGYPSVRLSVTVCITRTVALFPVQDTATYWPKPVYRAMHFSAKRGIAIACRLSVRLSVCL